MQKHTIVGLLVIIGVVVLLLVRKEQREAGHDQDPERAEYRTRVHLKRVNDAVEMYRLHHKKAPDSLDDLVELHEGEAFIEELPRDAWGAHLIYQRKGEHRWKLRSVGADGQFDTDDDIIHGN